MNAFFKKETACESSALVRSVGSFPPPADYRLPITAHRSPPAARRDGFTLAEMLVVIVIIAILISMLGGAYIQARNHAKRARAETQLHELVKAWNLYYMTYTNWPSVVGGAGGGTFQMQQDTTMQPLFATDTTGSNTKQIPFLSISIAPGATYCDPWGNPYNIVFGQGHAPQQVALRIAVSFPNRDRYR